MVCLATRVMKRRSAAAVEEPTMTPSYLLGRVMSKSQRREKRRRIRLIT
jgi:hypothetical protein